MRELAIDEVSEGGRPTKKDKVRVSKLVASFQRGFSNRTACSIAEISEKAYYRWLKEDEEFSQTMQAAKSYGTILAGDIVLDVLEDIRRRKVDPLTGVYIEGKYGQKTLVDTAKWYLEKQEEKFSSRVVVDASLQQNSYNFFNINDTDLTIIATNTGITNLDPTKLIEASTVEDLAGGTSENGTTPIHTQEFQDQHSSSTNLPQP